MRNTVLRVLAIALAASVNLAAQDVSGDWQGTLHRGAENLRSVNQFSRSADGTWKVTLWLLDQRPYGPPILSTSAVLKDSVLKITFDEVSGVYEAKLSADGRTFRGTWSQRGSTYPIDYQRVTKENAWAEFTVDAAARAKAIDGAAAQLNEAYVFPDVAKKMEEAVRAHEKRGDYDTVTDGRSFAARLTADLRAVSHDKHLNVTFGPGKVAPTPPAPGPDAEAQYRRAMENVNCGFEKVELLPGNVGYLKFSMFADPSVCGPTATAAMNFLGNASALIVDLRENGGGDPRMIAYLCSYLFAQPTHLNDVWTRKGDVTQQFWTLPYVPGKLLADKPVFVLTSNRTFSGAEEFTYDLKNLKRATVVGETTGGGAHLVGGRRINEHFMIGVPFAQAINPVSKTNWEGTGVEPDVKVPAADALVTAQKLAAEKLAGR